jgi:hypothetical protein
VTGNRKAAGAGTGTGAIPARDGAILLGILALAAALRLPGLDGPLWYDEILTLETHLRLPWGRMMEGYALNHHYLYSFLAKAATELFGESAWAIRLPALLFGLISIAAMWGLARRIAGPLAAHGTALLLALSFHHIWFSQNARGYTGLLLFSVLGLSLFLEGLRDPRPRTWALFALVLAAAAFTHLTGIFLFAALGVLWLLRLLVLGREATRAGAILPGLGFAGGLGLALLLHAPVLPGILASAGGVAATSEIDVMQEYQNPLWTLLEAGRTLVGQGGLPALAALVLGAAGLTLGAVRLHPKEPLLAPAILLHIALTMALLSVLGMRIWPRFFLPDIGFLMLLAVEGTAAIAVLLAPLLARFLPPALSAPRLTLLGLGLLALASAGLAARNYTAPKQDLAGAVAHVAANPGGRVYAVGVAAPVFTGHFATGWGTIATGAELAAALAEPGPLRIVIAFPARSFRAVEGLQQAVDSGALVLEKRLPGTLGDGAVLIFARPGARPGA